MSTYGPSGRGDGSIKPWDEVVCPIDGERVQIVRGFDWLGPITVSDGVIINPATGEPAGRIVQRGERRR